MKDIKGMFLFTVYDKDKVPVMSTNFIECIYEKDILKALKDAGYKFKLNGKSATISEIAAYVKENQKKA